VALETSTLSGWVGAAAPLTNALAVEVFSCSETLHADDTPVPVLAPGAGSLNPNRI